MFQQAFIPRHISCICVCATVLVWQSLWRSFFYQSPVVASCMLPVILANRWCFSLYATWRRKKKQLRKQQLWNRSCFSGWIHTGFSRLHMHPASPVDAKLHSNFIFQFKLSLQISVILSQAFCDWLSVTTLNQPLCGFCITTMPLLNAKNHRGSCASHQVVVIGHGKTICSSIIIPQSRKSLL